MGEVLQITSGKTCLLLELFLGQVKGIYTIVGQPRQKDNPRNASQSSCSPR